MLEDCSDVPTSRTGTGRSSCRPRRGKGRSTRSGYRPSWPPSNAIVSIEVRIRNGWQGTTFRGNDCSRGQGTTIRGKTLCVLTDEKASSAVPPWQPPVPPHLLGLGVQSRMFYMPRQHQFIDLRITRHIPARTESPTRQLLQAQEGSVKAAHSRQVSHCQKRTDGKVGLQSLSSAKRPA